VRIGILGAGRFGSAAARVLARAGYQVVLSNRRGRVALAPLIEEIGSGALAGRPVEAALAPVVILAVPWGSVEDVLEEIAPLEDIVLVDATNAWGGWEQRGDETGSSQLVQRLAAPARVVKAFNTVHANRLDAPGGVGLPIAGDVPAARAMVAQIAARIGFSPVELPSLQVAGPLMAPDGPLFGAYLPADVLERLISASS